MWYVPFPSINRSNLRPQKRPQLTTVTYILWTILYPNSKIFVFLISVVGWHGNISVSWPGLTSPSFIHATPYVLWTIHFYNSLCHCTPRNYWKDHLCSWVRKYMIFKRPFTYYVITQQGRWMGGVRKWQFLITFSTESNHKEMVRGVRKPQIMIT